MLNLGLLNANISMNNPSNNNLFEGIEIKTSQIAFGEGGGDLVNCNCGLIWGTGCKADNYGATCWSGDDCTQGANNCD
jgi:hypothetical protein